MPHHPDHAGLTMRISGHTMTLGVVGIGYLGQSLRLTFFEKLNSQLISLSADASSL